MLGAVSGVITIGEAGIAFAISLPLGVDKISVPIETPVGDVSTMGIGPPLTSAANILPGLSYQHVPQDQLNIF